MTVLVCSHLVYCIIMIIARPDVHTSIATDMHTLGGGGGGGVGGREGGH